MKLKKIGLLVVVISFVTTSGCASYRTSSNIKSEPTSAVKSEPTSAVSSNIRAIISEGSLPDRKYKEIGPIEVSVKKLTLFHKDPTKEQANEALIEKARAIGADAVINVTYEDGVGPFTWGYIDAKGIGVKFTE
jgi:hypothetical protein